MLTRSAFIEQWKDRMAAAMLYGMAAESTGGVLARAGHALDIVPKVPVLLGDMFDSIFERPVSQMGQQAPPRPAPQPAPQPTPPAEPPANNRPPAGAPRR